jgi:hypothetical protein
VQQVAAGRWLGDQVLVIQLVEPGVGGRHADAVEGGGSVGIDVPAGGQAQPAEQPLLVRGQVIVGQAERGRDRCVLGPHDGRPVARRRQIRGQFGRAPGGVVPELPGEHSDGQRQIPAQPGYLRGGRRIRDHFGAASQPGQQRRRVTGGEGVERKHLGVVQRGEPPAAGDQDQAPSGTRQQRPDLVVPGRVVQQQQDLLPGHLGTPPGLTGLLAGRDPLRRDASGQQQAGQRVGRVNRPLAGRVGVQRQEELPVGEAPGEPVRGVHGEGGLADARHAVDGVDRHGSAVGKAGESVQ